MCRVTFVGDCRSSERVVQRLLSRDHRSLSLAAKHVHVQENPGDIVLIVVGTSEGDVYLFDVKVKPTIMYDGQLWRIIQAESITKVMHDCRHTSAALTRQFGVTLRNVFDTQAAYCLLMMQHKLPPRQIALDDLYEKYGDPAGRLSERLEATCAPRSGLYWAGRPLSQAARLDAASEVMALLPAVYHNMLSELSPVSLPFLDELCDAYIHGKFRKAPKSENSAKTQSKPTRSSVHQLSNEQKHLLANTTTQSVSPISTK